MARVPAQVPPPNPRHRCLQTRWWGRRGDHASWPRCRLAPVVCGGGVLPKKLTWTCDGSSPMVTVTQNRRRLRKSRPRSNQSTESDLGRCEASSPQTGGRRMQPINNAHATLNTQRLNVKDAAALTKPGQQFFGSFIRHGCRVSVRAALFALSTRISAAITCAAEQMALTSRVRPCIVIQASTSSRVALGSGCYGPLNLTFAFEPPPRYPASLTASEHGVYQQHFDAAGRDAGARLRAADGRGRFVSLIHT
jgi:hypothetical protein